MVVGKFFALIMELRNLGNSFFAKWVAKVTDAHPAQEGRISSPS